MCRVQYVMRVGFNTTIGYGASRETGSVAPGQMGGHKPNKISGKHRDWLRQHGNLAGVDAVRRQARSQVHGHWKTTTFLAALRHNRIDTPWVLDGPFEGESFTIFTPRRFCSRP